MRFSADAAGAGAGLAAQSVLPDLQAAALGELLDLLEHQRRPVARARELVASAHFRDGRVPLGRSGVPVKPVPFGSEELAERVPDRKADADPVGPELLD